MARRKAQIRLSGRFPVGTTVELREVAPGALPGGPPMGAVVTRAKTNRESVTVFEDGVEEGRRYQATAEVDGVLRVVNVTGKVSVERDRQERPSPEDAGALRDPAGADDFAAADEAERKRLGEGAESAGLLVAPGNMPRQDEASDALQRSNTPLGEAVPKDEDEVVPYLDQRDYQDGKVVQRSDTELGMATPIPDVPRTQAEAREAGIWQASATPVGEAAPIRSGGPVVDRLAADSPEEAVGSVKVDPASAPAADADPSHRSRDELLALAARYEVQDPEVLDDAQLAATVLEREAAAGIDVEGRSVEDGEGDTRTKAELMDRARELGVEGRSKMTKAELADAVAGR